MTIARNGMIHLNNNLLCAVSCLTTGPVAGFHDLYQVAVLPLDCELRPTDKIPPFYCDMQLKRPDNISDYVRKKQYQKVCQAQISGIEPYRAADLFDEWHRRLGLEYGKMVVPLAHDWPQDRSFFIDWLGPETFGQLISTTYRDTLVSSLYANDRADFHNELCPYAKNDLKWLASVFKIPTIRGADALQKCILMAEVYRQMCKS